MKTKTEETTAKSYTTTIKECKCVNAYQDSIYGKNKRVHNKAGSAGKAPVARCTVCGSEKGGVI